MNSTAQSGSTFGKMLSVLFILGLIILVVLLDMKRRDAEQKLTQLSMQYEQQGGNQAQNREAAQLIIEKVRRLYEIPPSVEPTVATIVDVQQLRARNAFYTKAKNGDHLIVTGDRAILYDPVADKIIDVVPVQIQAAAQAATQGSVKAGSSAPAKK